MFRSLHWLILLVPWVWRRAPRRSWNPDLLAAVHRFLESPLKRKHARRTAHQALEIVARED